ncbi:MAG: Xaa-Pro peptidase family protein [Desulfobacterales bacterium]|nr:Xaa-Pro peptidase family protein [Desulfobacterales bacterium]
MLPLTPTTPREELDDRITRFQQELAAAGLDGALLLQNTDLFYLAGTVQQAHLFVPAAGAPVLMVRKSLVRARAESALDHVVALRSPRQIADILEAHGHPPPERLGMELDVIPAALYLQYARLFEDAALTDISPGLRRIRAVKSEYELDLMREAARQADAVAGSVKDLIREGMTEIELAGRVEAEARRRGHQGIVRMRMFGGEMFYGHLLAGPPAAVPSYLASPTGGTGVSPAVAQGAGFDRIRPGEPILLDYVFAWQGYIADHTRIFALGELPADLLEAHQAMLDLQAIIRRKARPGTPAGDLYAAAVTWAADNGWGEWFMGADDQRIRFIGHGVGLELDEYPFLAKGQDMPLVEGMTIALEPKLIIPGRGVVGIENTHVVTAEGLEPLTRFDDAVQMIA